MFAESIRRPRLLAQLLGAFAVLALLLGGVGTYGVLSYMVTARRREIGVRMALGASRSSVIGLVMKQGLQATVVGVIVGVAGAFAANRMIASLLFGVQPTDAATMAGVIATISTVAAFACQLPGWRASRLDPESWNPERTRVAESRDVCFPEGGLSLSISHAFVQWPNRYPGPCPAHSLRTSLWPRNGNICVQPACRSVSNRLSHSPIWFQLANVRVTIQNKRLSARSIRRRNRLRFARGLRTDVANVGSVLSRRPSSSTLATSLAAEDQVDRILVP